MIAPNNESPLNKQSYSSKNISISSRKLNFSELQEQSPVTSQSTVEVIKLMSQSSSLSNPRLQKGSDLAVSRRGRNNFNSGTPQQQSHLVKLSSSTVVTNRLKNFVKHKLKDESYIHDFKYLHGGPKTLICNKLTKPTYDIKETFSNAAPQTDNHLQKSLSYSHIRSKSQNSSVFLNIRANDIKQRKQAVSAYYKTKKQETKGLHIGLTKKSYIPEAYRKTLSLDASKSVNISTENEEIFATNTNNNVTTIQAKNKLSLKVLNQQNRSSDTLRNSMNFGILPRFKSLKKLEQSAQRSVGLQFQGQRSRKDHSTLSLERRRSKHYLTERKISRLNHKIDELKEHVGSIKTLIPKIQEQKVKANVVGKGEQVSKEKIERLIDKTIQIIEVYFNMYEFPDRVTNFFKRVEGFEQEKVQMVLLCKASPGEGNGAPQSQRVSQLKPQSLKGKKKTGSSNLDAESKNAWVVRRFTDPVQIKKFFLVFQYQSNPESLPEFFGEEDWALYRSLNNFILKLEVKYETLHKEKFQKMENIRVQDSKQELQKKNMRTFSKEFANEDPSTSSIPNKESRSSDNRVTSKVELMLKKNLSERTVHMLSLQKQPKIIKNDQKIHSQISDLQSLGVKFNYREKGRGMILSERNKATYQ